MHKPSILSRLGDNAQKTNKADEDEEEDYMSMTIVEPQQAKRETFAERKLRKQRESEAKSRMPTKAELAAAEAARRDAALSTSTLDPSNKGFKMMARLGYKPGSALGKPQSSNNNGSPVDDWDRRITEPLGVQVKEDRGGIGLDAEKKRKFRQEVEHEAKRTKAEETDFRERVRLEREEKRAESLFQAAQKVAERLDAESELEQIEGKPTAKEDSEAEESIGTAKCKDSVEETSSAPSSSKPSIRTKPTSQINILYRGLVRSREEKQRELQTRRGLYDSLSSGSHKPLSDLSGLPVYDDTELDTDDKLALGQTADDKNFEAESDEEEEDAELEEFNQLSSQERLSRVVSYLREKHWYCFWCKYRYETDELDGCPGPTEEDHD
ncbi:hypothetical protein AJ80_04460 [Polytolypa hystricis UAMH7299]|uniref:G-patch domain-containing protein n=1 Tax=Polytolypa hystricis (strain UAMH7299) TaxID=1447883 RepID=A0A2B7YBC5_POLH7|nr:hypothetical protein AJ80_04460 [Polytolypa hystricis UAMH7299]